MNAITKSHAQLHSNSNRKKQAKSKLLLTQPIPPDKSRQNPRWKLMSSHLGKTRPLHHVEMVFVKLARQNRVVRMIAHLIAQLRMDVIRMIRFHRAPNAAMEPVNLGKQQPVALRIARPQYQSLNALPIPSAVTSKFAVQAIAFKSNA